MHYHVLIGKLLEVKAKCLSILLNYMHTNDNFKDRI